MDLQFRDAQAMQEDIEEIQRLAGIIWHRHFTPMLAEGQVAYMLEHMFDGRRMLEEVATRAVHWELLIAENTEIGFCASHADGTELNISKLYLLQEWHGRGLGQKSLHHFVELAREQGLRALNLRVNRNNALAIAAYERFGFEIQEELVEEIGGGFIMDDYRMGFTLPA
jgi:GNAT superfamily N-acetyltransferase